MDPGDEPFDLLVAFVASTWPTILGDGFRTVTLMWRNQRNPVVSKALVKWVMITGFVTNQVLRLLIDKTRGERLCRQGCPDVLQQMQRGWRGDSWAKTRAVCNIHDLPYPSPKV